jgi:hypothetical protein
MIKSLKLFNNFKIDQHMEINKNLINYDSSDGEEEQKPSYVYVELDGKIVNRIEVSEPFVDKNECIFNKNLIFSHFS